MNREKYYQRELIKLRDRFYSLIDEEFIEKFGLKPPKAKFSFDKYELKDLYQHLKPRVEAFEQVANNRPLGDKDATERFVIMVIFDSIKFRLSTEKSESADNSTDEVIIVESSTEDHQ